MLGNRKIPNDELDKILYQKILQITDIKSIENTESESILKDYVSENETFTHIKIDPVNLYIDKKINDQKIKIKYYAVPIKYEERAKYEIERLLKADIIEENRSPYASPSFLIEKKNRELRLVVDYRIVNNYIKDDISLIPKIFENLYKIEKSKFFTKIDLKNGFNQIKIDENSRNITSFTIF
ncbi:Retrovirus-related Pol polyprotein from transposon [Dictyocoela muelleri]|nr:Retrovirus-related Pol polyprotein from transposon [Dictyocoela muelleri]